MANHGISGARGDGPLRGESDLQFQQRVIDANERRHAAPRMTIITPINPDNDFSKDLIKNIYPDSEFDDDGNMTVIKKDSAGKFPDLIWLEIDGNRYKFRFTGEGLMNFEGDVMKMEIEMVGLF